MFNLRAGEGGEFRTRDTAQGFLFLSPDAVSSLSDLVYTLIGDMHDAIGVSVQQVTHTDTHTGDGNLPSEVHTDRVAMGDDKPGAEVLETAKRADFPDIAQAAVCEDTNSSKLLHACRHHLAGMAGVKTVRAGILHDHNSWLRGVRQQFIQLLEADALTPLGGAINGAGDGIANSGRQFREDAADIVAHVPCNTRTQFEGFDGVGDCRTINAAYRAELLVAELSNHVICSFDAT